MGKAHTKNIMKRVVDALMTILLLFMMAYQVTGEFLHEWIGIGMTVLVIIHQILNRKWYGSLFAGKYNPYRTVTTVLNFLLLLSFAVTAFSGMSMSSFAVPFLYGMAPVYFARRMHLSMSHWSFDLMGLHLGIHIPVILAGIKLRDRTKTVLSCLFTILAGYGLFLFLRNGMQDYLFFRVPFAFLDYEKAWWLVLLENLVMLSFWVFIGTQISSICRNAVQKVKSKGNPLLPIVWMMAAVIIGTVLMLSSASAKEQAFSGDTGWSQPQVQETEVTESENIVEAVMETIEPEETAAVNVEDGFVLINGGSFLMGSPETENWRIDDEMQHEVTVSSFYIDPRETTQAEYKRLMGEDPANFQGDDLPVENITWLEALAFENAKSADAGLTPVYTINGNSVSWDRSANGYRLPTEAEWEYACRAGTNTPFNTEKSLNAEEANFYGHYPYEIEENYFDNSVLEARPGKYRQTTITPGSFEPNAWGLYDMHGNVNEWCWDYYGPYDLSAVNDPTDAESGTRHVYRGGGWNDFAKNMRSAYRAAGQENFASFNLGIRLVRNADGTTSGIVHAGGNSPETKNSGKILIAYFSWGGNTRGIAREIQKQTGADLFEITPVHPYSSDYNTVLMEAQEDQHKQARPELAAHVEGMEGYDIILLGYPNWWASIPMPIASFLEEYDFSGKTIIPFCSHGGGRFGQSQTAIAKLAPDAVIGEGLSVHYSGGSSLPDDVSAWLTANGITESR